MTPRNPTQADENKAYHFLHWNRCPHDPVLWCEGCSHCPKCLASELAAARIEGEIAEHKKLCRVCRRFSLGHMPKRNCERIKQLDEQCPSLPNRIL